MMFNLNKQVITATMIMLSSIASSASLSIPTIQLEPVVVPFGGKTEVEISLQPIKDYTPSRWAINCAITNPSIDSVILKFDMSLSGYAQWPGALLNEQYLNMEGHPQGLLKPGVNNYLLVNVNNKDSNALKFVNFDTDQDVSVTCSAAPSID